MPQGVSEEDVGNFTKPSLQVALANILVDSDILVLAEGGQVRRSGGITLGHPELVTAQEVLVHEEHVMAGRQSLRSGSPRAIAEVRSQQVAWRQHVQAAVERVDHVDVLENSGCPFRKCGYGVSMEPEAVLCATHRERPAFCRLSPIGARSCRICSDCRSRLATEPHHVVSPWSVHLPSFEAP